jgi:hypothetical protein
MSALFLIAVITPALLFFISGQIVLTLANIGAMLLIAGLATSITVAIAAMSKAVK